MAAPKKVDYARIEPAWRAGIKSLPQLAAEYTEATGVSVTPQAIVKHFQKLSVPRDLEAKVQARADAMVREAMVQPKVGAVTLATTKADSEIIEDSAAIVAQVRLTHRTDIGRARGLSMTLLDELAHQTESQDDYRKLAELLLDGEDGPADAKGQEKRWAAFERAISLSGRVTTMKALADSLKTLVALEREAFGIVTEPTQPGGEGDIHMHF